MWWCVVALSTVKVWLKYVLPVMILHILFPPPEISWLSPFYNQSLYLTFPFVQKTSFYPFLLLITPTLIIYFKHFMRSFIEIVCLEWDTSMLSRYFSFKDIGTRTLHSLELSFCISNPSHAPFVTTNKTSSFLVLMSFTISPHSQSLDFSGYTSGCLQNQCMPSI